MVQGGVFLDQRVDHVAQNIDDLRPCDRIRGAEAAVGAVRQVAVGFKLRYIGQRIFRNRAAVCIADGSGLRRNAKGSADHGHRLLAGNGAGRKRLALIAQINAGSMELQDGVLPIGSRRVGKGICRRGRLKVEKPIQNSRQRPLW